MITIDLDKAHELVAEVVAEHGDFCYREHFDYCKYVITENDDDDARRTENPPINRCIVGQVLHKVGVADDVLAILDGTVTDIRYDLCAYGDVDIAVNARSYLRRLQNTQDTLDVTWAEASALVDNGIESQDHDTISQFLGRDIRPFGSL